MSCQSLGKTTRFQGAWCRVQCKQTENIRLLLTLEGKLMARLLEREYKLYMNSIHIDQSICKCPAVE